MKDDPTDLEAHLMASDLKAFFEAMLHELQRHARLRGAGVSMFVALPLPNQPIAFGGNVPLPTAGIHAAICVSTALAGGGESGQRETPAGIEL